MKEYILVVSVIITVASVIPYIRNILRATTKPNIASWITWALLNLVATIAEFAAGQYKTAIFSAASTIATSAVVILGLKYGYAKYSRFDAICQIAALSGFIFWYAFHTPAAAVITVVSIDFIGSLPTYRHAWLKPNEETWITFAVSGFGALLAIIAITDYNWTSLTYAAYILFNNTVISSVIIYRGNGHNKLNIKKPRLSVS